MGRGDGGRGLGVDEGRVGAGLLQYAGRRGSWRGEPEEEWVCWEEAGGDGRGKGCYYVY